MAITPLERAARAFFTRDPGPYGDCIEWAIEQDFGWRDRVDVARAVIEAIREPSSAMEAAGGDIGFWDFDLGLHNDATAESEAGKVYTAMIDALLEEGA